MSCCTCTFIWWHILPHQTKEQIYMKNNKQILDNKIIFQYVYNITRTLTLFPSL